MTQNLRQGASWRKTGAEKRNENNCPPGADANAGAP
jgi:hypothetical protein